MNARLFISLSVALALCVSVTARTRQPAENLPLQTDTVIDKMLPTIYVYPPLKFKNKRQERRYNKLVRDVKIVLPIAKEVNQIVIETYEYIQTLPEGKARQRHLKAVEKGLKAQYMPRMRKLTFSQGKLLIKLIDRQTSSTSYELVKAFLGSFRAAFYQAFAAMFGASLKKEYDAEGDDRLTERVITLVENGQL